MRQRKKAQGLSLETIIIALLVLLVLVIIGFIFMTQSNNFRKGLVNCAGTCSQTITCSSGLATPMAGCRDSSGNTGYSFCCPPPTTPTDTE